jgi:hypothetical protein
MCGTGEYTTGFVGTGGKTWLQETDWCSIGAKMQYLLPLYLMVVGSQSDKKIGVVGLVMFDLRRRGKVSSDHAFARILTLTLYVV